MVITDLLAYHRGIWSWFDLPDIGDMKGEQKLEFVVTAVEDIDQHRNDMSFIKKEFPLPAFGDDLVIQTYPTREKFSESNNTSRVPEDEDEDEYEVFLDLPFTRSVSLICMLTALLLTLKNFATASVTNVVASSKVPSITASSAMVSCSAQVLL